MTKSSFVKRNQITDLLNLNEKRYSLIDDNSNQLGGARYRGRKWFQPFGVINSI